jgi:undecaprenyl-diphosphatase
MTALDDSLLRWLNQFAGRNEAFDRLVVEIADSALLKGALFMAYFWYLWFRSDGDIRARRGAVVTSLIGAVIAAVVARSLQVFLPLHDRPLHDPGLHFTLPFGVNPETLNHWNSFPSDHAVLFFALSVAVAAQSRRLGIMAAVWTLVIVCLPRIYLGYHYPSDVVAGAVIGAVIMLATQRVIGAAAFVRGIVAWERSNARLFYGLAFLVTYEIAFLFFDVRSLGIGGYRLLRSMMLALA